MLGHPYTLIYFISASAIDQGVYSYRRIDLGLIQGSIRLIHNPVFEPVIFDYQRLYPELRG
jgi:hypothetical protein